MYNTDQYETLIKEASIGKIETVLLGDSSIILNFDKWRPQNFRKYETSTETILTVNKKDKSCDSHRL